MNKGSLYPKLAFQNIKNNRKFYIPYMLTGIIVVMMFYIILFLANHEGMGKVYGGRYLNEFLSLGTIIIAMFSVIFLFYTNSFLMKRRKKELGLYIVLGMEKRHLARVQLFETLFVGLMSIAGGIACGILFSKLSMLIMGKILRFETPLGFSVSVLALYVTAAVFFCIYLLIFIHNLIAVGKAKPIELLQSGNVGEKEPKTKWVLTVIGTLCLLGGYAIAILVKSPLSAITLFFVAVILVIIGTYMLFTTGSITLLKSLKNNKNYYYQTRHFISVSGMIYRMKQNAVGLANICILSTMVLVMLSGTVALNVGMEDILNKRYPADIIMTYNDPGDGVVDAAVEEIKAFADERNVEIEQLDVVTDLSFVVSKNGDEYTGEKTYSADTSRIGIFDFVTTDEYERRTGEKLELGENEVYLHSDGFDFGDSFTLFGQELHVNGKLESFPREGENSAMILNVTGIVVSPETFDKICDLQREAYGDDCSNIKSNIYLDIEGTDEQESEIFQDMYKELSEKVSGSYVTEDGRTVELTFYSFYGECRSENSSEIYSMYGSFLFLGIFLGILFIMATILIMYYKQLTEGYNDKERFEIMQKVGLSRPEIRKSIHSQILVVFFLPLLTAVLHMAFAFKIITKLLALLNLTNVTLFVICTVCTIAVFAVIYGIVYALTAREYYKIVSQ
ncbi:MAG: FtsX-like permease family protein [Clostridiales bacterium]|nr:FtsX-like permease family protein [Clostridiales bacterium]